MSEGREPEQMHSFRRRGSTKKSVARAGSLRRHASHNSILSRHLRVSSVDGQAATFARQITSTVSSTWRGRTRQALYPTSHTPSPTRWSCALNDMTRR
jgi:hypothetical protein